MQMDFTNSKIKNLKFILTYLTNLETCFQKITSHGAIEMAQPLKVLTALPEDLDSIQFPAPACQLTTSDPKDPTPLSHLLAY